MAEVNQKEASIRVAISSAEIWTRGFSKTKQSAIKSTFIFRAQVWLIFRMRFTYMEDCTVESVLSVSTYELSVKLLCLLLISTILYSRGQLGIGKYP